MYSTKLPLTLRSGYRTRALNLGLDLPSWFYDGLKGLDENLYCVWHPYQIQWNDIMNLYTGPVDDPRLAIGPDPRFGAEEQWGWVLTDGQGRPQLENRWHVWRLCTDRGWAHIFPVEKTSDADLHFYLRRLYLRSQIQDKYGLLGWNQFEAEEQKLVEENRVRRHEDLFFDTMRENKGLLRNVVENMERGVTGATNPTRDVIRSYAGQKHHDRIEVPLSDKEGGFVTPDDL